MVGEQIIAMYLLGLAQRTLLAQGNNVCGTNSTGSSFELHLSFYPHTDCSLLCYFVLTFSLPILFFLVVFISSVFTSKKCA